jgi:glyoxylase-like metal-dependent hydrolase (beta-lactamase superfamily II)
VPFTEVADRVWVARYEWFDVNVSLIAGDRGLLAVDTHASAVAAREVIDDIRRLGVGEVVAVVNTHEHFDHTFGNGEFRTAYGSVPIHAHETAAERTVPAGERIKGLYDEEPDDPHRQEVQATTIVPADRTFSSAAALDLGDRLVELVHPGRGHTGGDLVVRLDDADVLLAGDLVEEGGPPMFGDAYPLDWPATVAGLLRLATPATVVVPGHGAVVDAEFVRAQHAELTALEWLIRDGHADGATVDEVAAKAPFGPRVATVAVERGYAELSGRA